MLRAIEARVGAESIQYVGVGPRRNFRARRWWQALGGRRCRTDGADRALRCRRGAAENRETLWRERYAIRDALWAATRFAQHAVDPRLRLPGRSCASSSSGIALLQFPWSARSMDEAAAALDAIEPEVAVTYAEAGGWGRALALECRRRGIPLAGLQHGFIYRHWLNYRHEAGRARCRMRANPLDAGFPRPAVTLLFDDYTAQLSLRRPAVFLPARSR